MNNQERVKLAQHAAMQAGKMLLSYRDFHVDKKSQKDYVTDADRASEALIRGILMEACPQDGFYGEEGGVSGGEKRGMWVVDPIDGTTNFIHGLHPYTISIAYVEDGQPRAGVVYAPVTNEMFSAWEGGGAWLNDNPIHVSSVTEPVESILGMSFASRVPECARRMYKLIPKLGEQVQDMRRLASAAHDLCCVACGRYDAFIELRLNLYDIAAGVLIVREAGGMVGGWPDGEDCLISGDVVAATPGLFDWLRSQLTE